MDTTATEEKIITATVECIEKYGIKGTTIRQIAETAGVNIAAINYYFRSKDQLFEAVFTKVASRIFLPLMRILYCRNMCWSYTGKPYSENRQILSNP